MAQNENLRFEHIGIEEGLSNEIVIAILQDSKGFIWFGTTGGLFKYDGYAFTTYQFDPLDSTSLSQNLVYTIWEDKYGSIWVGTTDGLCRFDRSTEKFTRYKPDEKAKFSDPNIPAINEDNDGMMWVAGISSGLCRFDRQTGMFLSERFDINEVSCIYKDRAGVLWVGNQTGLHRLNLSAKKAGNLSKVSFTPYQHNPGNSNSLSSNRVTSVFEDRQGILWVTTDNGLNSFDRETGIFKRYTHDPKNIHSISSNNFAGLFGNNIKEDQQGNLWIATDKGLNKLNTNRTSFTSYFHNPDDAYSLSINTVISLHIDSAGVLFAGCLGGKLNKANLNSKPFGLKRSDPNNVNSLSSNAVTSIIEDSAGIIWIATYGGGLNRWDRKADRFTHFRQNPSNSKALRSDTIMDLLEDIHGHLWVCNAGVLSQLNKQTREFIHYNSNVKNYKDEHSRFIFSITEDREGIIWLGTGNGVKRFNEKNGEFQHYYYNPADTNSPSDYTATTIFADSRDDIWVGYGSRGTDKFNKRTSRFIHYKHNARDSTSISSNVVKSFFEDSKGIIWLGTVSGGLCYFDHQTEKFRPFTDKHGLPDNTVYSIMADNKNHLWLGTDKGLSRFDPVTKTFTNYDYRDGLQSNKFAAGGGGGDMDRGACCKGRDGTLYFGGPNGFNFFDPLQLKAHSYIAPVVITQFKLFDKLVKGANESIEIVLDYDQNYFSFEFSSLSYYSPSKNKYAYKLEGVDKDWVYSGSRRYAGYTNIDHGNYIFRVKGTNNDDVWNEKGTYITIKIKPPWWLTWWAYFFYGVCFITGIYFIARYQRKRIINKESERSREKELEHAREIEKAYHELKTTQAQLIQSEKMASLGELTAGIAHEIQNPLNFVNNFSEVNNELLEEMKTAIASGDISELNLIATDLQSNLEKINQHGKRADGIVKSMMLHSRQGSMQKEPTDINNLADEYLRLSYHGHRAKDKSFNVTLRTNFDESIGKVSVVPQELGRVLLNIYNNAFYAVQEKKKKQSDEYEPTVEVSTSKSNSRLELKIRDNGSGISAKVRDKIFQPFFTTKPTGQGTGLGLSMSYDIIKMHQGELDLVTEEGVGTEFIIRLPAN